MIEAPGPVPGRALEGVGRAAACFVRRHIRVSFLHISAQGRNINTLQEARPAPRKSTKWDKIRANPPRFSGENILSYGCYAMRFVTIRLRSVALLLALAVALLPACLFAHYTDAAAVWWSSGARSLPVYSVERQDNKIAISFDCAWGADYTRTILEHLAAANVRATFFCVQFWAETYPDVLKEISDAGHEVGTHSATHSYMSRLSEEEIRAELTGSCAAIEAATGKKVDLFRPPYGDYDDLLIDTCLDMGILPI